MNTVRLATSLWQLDVLIGLAISGALIVASVLAWRKGYRVVALCTSMLVVCFVPASNVLTLIQVFFAERIWYLPSVWAAVLLAILAVSLIPKRAILVVMTFVCIGMFARCWVRNFEWKNNATVAAAAHRDHPDSIATLVMYGNLLATTGNIEKGIELLNRAVELDSGFTVAHRALGQAYALAGDDRRSLHYWRIAEMQFPGHPQVRAALRMLGERLASRAHAELERLKRNADDHPDNLAAELAYVRRLLELARHDEALTRFMAAEKRFNNDAAWQQQYGSTLLYAGNRDEALRRYRVALRLARHKVSPYIDVAALLMERQTHGDLTEATALLDRAHVLAPGDPNVAVLRAELLALKGDLLAASAAYRTLLRSIPADHPQRAPWEARAKLQISFTRVPEIGIP